MISLPWEDQRQIKLYFSYCGWFKNSIISLGMERCQNINCLQLLNNETISIFQQNLLCSIHNQCTATVKPRFGRSVAFPSQNKATYIDCVYGMQGVSNETKSSTKFEYKFLWVPNFRLNFPEFQSLEIWYWSTSLLTKGCSWIMLKASRPLVSLYVFPSFSR